MKLFKMFGGIGGERNDDIEQEETIKRSGVLIVDDSRFSINILRDILIEEGFEVVGEASDGLEAIQKAKELRPEFIFLDVEMPKLDGLGALPQLLEDDPGVNVIMCTALGQKKIIIEATKAGAKDYVIKPYKKEHITDLLETLKPEEAEEEVDNNVIPFDSESKAAKTGHDSQKGKSSKREKYKPVQEYNKDEKDKEEPNLKHYTGEKLGSASFDDEERLPISESLRRPKREEKVAEATPVEKEQIDEEILDLIEADQEDMYESLVEEEKTQGIEEFLEEVTSKMQEEVTEIEDTAKVADATPEVEAEEEAIVEEETVAEEEAIVEEETVAEEETIVAEEIATTVEEVEEVEELAASVDNSFVYLWADRFEYEKASKPTRSKRLTNRVPFKSKQFINTSQRPTDSRITMLGDSNSERLARLGMMNAYMEKGYKRIKSNRVAPNITRTLKIEVGRSFVEDILQDRQSNTNFSIADIVSNVDVNSIMHKEEEKKTGIYNAIADMVTSKGQRKLYMDI